MSSADVSRIQPVNLQAPGRLMFPTEEVRVSHAARISIGRVTNAVGAGARIGQRKSSLGHCDRR